MTENETKAEVRLNRAHLHTLRDRIHVFERRLHDFEAAQHLGALRTDALADELAGIRASIDSMLDDPRGETR